MREVQEVAQRRKNGTATFVLNGAQNMVGVLCGPVSGGTIKVADAAGTILNTMTPAVGQFLAMPGRVHGDVTVTLSGTIDVTAFYS